MSLDSLRHSILSLRRLTGQQAIRKHDAVLNNGLQAGLRKMLDMQLAAAMTRSQHDHPAAALSLVAASERPVAEVTIHDKHRASLISEHAAKLAVLDIDHQHHQMLTNWFLELSSDDCVPTGRISEQQLSEFHNELNDVSLPAVSTTLPNGAASSPVQAFTQQVHSATTEAAAALERVHMRIAVEHSLANMAIRTDDASTSWAQMVALPAACCAVCYVAGNDAGHDAAAIPLMILSTL